MDQYLFGTWLVDSTGRPLIKEEHARIRLFEFRPGGEAISHFYSFHHNKEYVNPIFYTATDTALVFKENPWIGDPFNMGYRVERLSADRVRLVAKFPTSNVTYPEWDSIIWFSRVNSAEEHLRSFLASGEGVEVACAPPNMSLVGGYWRIDSAETPRYTLAGGRIFYKFIDPSGTLYDFQLGRRPFHSTDSISIDGPMIISKGGHGSDLVKCLDEGHMMWEEPDRPNSYGAMYFTRIDPDSIIPDSFRVDKMMLQPTSLGHVME